MGARPSADPTGATSARERAAMVATQLRRRGIADERVLAAMSTIPREWFVDAAVRRHAYDDAALPIASGQSISQPYMVARMTELLAVRPGDRVLEIGTGSGYQAAILARLGARVLSIERLPELAATATAHLDQLDDGDRVEVRVGDGSLGAPDDAPFDGIVVTAGSPEIPDLAPRAARRGRPSRHPRRAARPSAADPGDPARQRLGATTRGRLRLRPARRGGRLAEVGRYTRPDHEPRVRRPTPG